jgi:hypothetical protein
MPSRLSGAAEGAGNAYAGVTADLTPQAASSRVKAIKIKMIRFFMVSPPEQAVDLFAS